MAVVLANTTLSARRKEHTYDRDARGVPTAAATWTDPTDASPGAVHSPESGPDSPDLWSIRADMALWPLRADDELTDADGRVFIVATARSVQVPGCDFVDHIQVRASLAPPATA